MKNKQIKRAIDTNLSSLRVTERDVQRIMTQVREGKKVKKKLSVGFVLAVMLILITMTAVAVGLMSGMRYWEAQNADVGSPLDMAVLDGKVYLTTEDGFFEWNPETGEATNLNGLGLQTLYSSLFVRDGQLMLFGKPGKLWRYENSGWKLERDYTGTPLAAHAAKKSNLIYWQDCILMPEYNEDGTSQNLLKLNLKDGSVQLLYEGNVLRLCNYRDGKILAVLIVDEENERLVVMDAETGEIAEEITQMHLFAMKGLAYDEKNDRIYAMVDGALSMWNGQEWQFIRQATLPWLTHSYAVVDDLYLAASHLGIQSIALNMQQPEEQITLTINGINAVHGNIDHDFQQTHVNVAVSRRTQNSMNAQEIASAIQNGDETDLFYFRMDASWPELLNSGLLETITSDQLILQNQEMAEVFQQLVFQDDQLQAVISDAFITVWTKQTQQVPQTLTELFSQKYTALTWEFSLWNQDQYISYLIDQQIMEQGTQFNTPSFRQALEMLRVFGCERRSQPKLSTSRYFSMGNSDDDQPFIAPLGIAEESPEQYPVSLYMYVLNPNSRQKETAIAFLEYASSQMDAETYTILNPENARPALLPFTEKWIEDVKIQHAQDVKDGLLLDDPAALEERIENLRNMPGHQLVTQEKIDLYREKIFPRLTFELHPLLSPRNVEIREELQQTVKQYLNDEISQDEAIDALNATAERADQ